MLESTKSAIREMGGIICESLYDAKVMRVRFDHDNFILVKAGTVSGLLILTINSACVMKALFLEYLSFN